MRMHSPTTTLDRGAVWMPSSSSTLDRGTVWKPSSSSWLECNVTSCFKLLQPWLLCHDKALPPRLLLVTVFSHRNEMALRQVLRSRMGQAESLEKPEKSEHERIRIVCCHPPLSPWTKHYSQNSSELRRPYWWSGCLRFYSSGLLSLIHSAPFWLCHHWWTAALVWSAFTFTMQTTQVVTFNHARFCCLNMGSAPYAKGFRRHLWCSEIPEIEIKHALGNSRADFARVKRTLYSCRNMNCYIVIQTTENGKLLWWPRMWMRFLERERSPLYLWTVVHTEGKYICIHTHKAIY